MTIADQAKAIQLALSDWATSEKGKAFVASDTAHMWHMAYAGPVGTRAIVCYQGEDIRGDFSIAAALGRVDRHWIVLVTRGRGFNAERGNSLNLKEQNARPFYDLIDEARDLLRAMQLDTNRTERPIDFKSIRPVSLPDMLIDAYAIEFSIGTQLSQIEEGDYHDENEPQIVVPE